MTFDQINARLVPFGLSLFGGLHEQSGAAQTILLVGAEAQMWPVFQRAAEATDGRADPLDRWSKRILGALAQQFGAVATFPSDGPPYPPFITWAKRSRRFWSSPVGMLVHDHAGLMISLRGALILPGHLELPPAQGDSPCTSCPDKPCLEACPVDALGGADGYAVEVCRDHLRGAQGLDCMTGGCLARRACPLSARFNRASAQSAFHMRAFCPE